ncbi:MAG: FAD-dependent oxidoreductase [Lysobacteraceae bacterium]|nr:MAG: FAD-dependent oxidoreductase [Xanthomonadaceae bacterium]
MVDAGKAGGGASHGNCGTITPSHAPPLAAPGMVALGLRWMFTPDAPLYLKPRLDPGLWRWLAHFAARCNATDWRRSTQSRSLLLNDSRQRLADWVARFGLKCEFAEQGLDYVFRQQANFDHYARQAALLGEFGIDSQVLDGAACLRDEPALKPGVVGAVRFAGDARLRPDRYVAELARVVRERGGVVEEGCRVGALQEHGEGVDVSTDRGPRHAREVVVALGAWTPGLARGLGLHLPIQPGKGYSITYSRPSIVPSRPLVLKDRSVCVTVWDSGFRLGSTMEFSGYDPSLNATRLGALERAAAEYLHEPFGAQVQERWHGWRPMTWDDLPVLGRSPRHRHVWLAAGHGMLGVSMSAASGQLMADLMTGRSPALDPAPYRMERFA